MKSININEINSIIKLIKETEKIAIIPHVSADGDALGSSFALAAALRKLDKRPDIFLEEKVHESLSFLPGTGDAIIFDSKIFIEASMREYETAIAIDTGDIARMGGRVVIFDKAENTVNIDHHQTNTMFAGLNHITSAAAVAEMIYDIITMLQIEIEIDIATCLYTGIATDTGGFRYSNTTAETHRIAADLIDKGADIADISKRVFDTFPLKKIKLMGTAINVIELLENDKVAVLAITEDMLKATGADDTECDGLVNIGRSISGVEVSLVLREKENNDIRVNLRSNSYVDVSAIASVFSGGGHARAAGCTINGSILQAKKLVLDELKRVL